MSTGRTFELNDGNVIPALGLGTWQSQDKEVYDAVLIALKTGYRHIDAAFCYGNEVPVGNAIKNSGVPRESIFLTSKLWSTGHTRVVEELEASLKNLDVDYLDLYLMHWPVTLNPKGNHPILPTTPTGARDIVPEEEWNYIKTWAAMQTLLKTGKVKSIGVANFSTHHLEQLASAPTTTIVPAVNQVEMHPYNPQEKLIRYCNENGIHLTAYSPLGSTSAPLQEEGIVKAVAERLGKSAAQVLISWAIWRGTSVIPKSVTPSRIASNFEDCVMSDADGKLINEISKTTRKRIVSPNWGVKIFYDDD
ncbi:NADP-dependent oxidoreductase domain-containing protein [Lipomyces kononenkoae]|uniref:NADP-dependent oxidoreductase domain-containing protein n=1 Tax=Lipomyces kononenkoae TaxID=34357 RepID=A0ACC3SQN3_LIPKO